MSNRGYILKLLKVKKINNLSKLWDGVLPFVTVGILYFGVYHYFKGEYLAAASDYLFVIATTLLANKSKD
jgi:hypothetical protein